jgi:hypothetical protein
MTAPVRCCLAMHSPILSWRRSPLLSSDANYCLQRRLNAEQH